MPRVLLINPYFNSSLQSVPLNIPLGLTYLASYLRSKSVEVSIIDLSIPNKYQLDDNLWHFGYLKDQVSEIIRNEDAGIIGIGCPFSIRFQYVVEIAEIIKSINHNIKIVIGGIHPTIFAKEILTKYSCVDYIVIGEGEDTFYKLAISISNGQNLDNIDGIAFRNNSEVVVVPKKTYINDLDSLPFPARDLLPVDSYFNINENINKWGLRSKRTLSIISSRSCPFYCTFCSTHHVHGRKWRSRSPKNVVDEIEELIDKYKIDGIHFEDDNLTFNKSRIINICKEIIDRKINIEWNTPNGVSVKTLDLDILQYMKQAGCKSLNLAIESGDENIRNSVIGKGLSTQKIIEVVGICKSLEIEANAYFIVGLPGENIQSLKNTKELIEKLNLDQFSVYLATPFPGTKLYEHCVENSLIADNYLEELIYGKTKIFRQPVIKNPELFPRKIVEFRNYLMSLTHLS